MDQGAKVSPYGARRRPFLRNFFGGMFSFSGYDSKPVIYKYNIVDNIIEYIYIIILLYIYSIILSTVHCIIYILSRTHKLKLKLI